MKRAIGDDGIDWDTEAERAKSDAVFVTGAFEYFDECLKPGMVMLDLGCNIAKWYPAFKRFGVTYEGLDFSPVAIKEARQRYPEVTFYLMKAEDMNFVGRYDVIFTNTVLQHLNLESKKRVIPRVLRALKKGGYLIFQEKSDVETSTTFTREGWIEFMVGLGFEFIRSTPIGDPRNGYVFRRW